MSIIAPSDFKGTCTVAQRETPAVERPLQDFINQYEPEFLIKLLGQSLYADFIAGLAENPIDQKWIDLRDNTKLKAMIVNYVYFWYMDFNVTQSTGSGEVKPKVENAIQASPVQKPVNAWNAMVKLVREFYLDPTVYPEAIELSPDGLPTHVYFIDGRYRFNWCKGDIYNFKNTLGI